MHGSHRVHCMDFAFPLTNVFIDSKTTSSSIRKHIISSEDQVSSDGRKESYLLSQVIRPVSEGEGSNILDLIRTISSILLPNALSVFEERILRLKIEESIEPTLFS